MLSIIVSENCCSARTFSSALANIDRYGDYVFAASQAQYFQFTLGQRLDLVRGRSGPARG